MSFQIKQNFFRNKWKTFKYYHAKSFFKQTFFPLTSYLFFFSFIFNKNLFIKHFGLWYFFKHEIHYLLLLILHYFIYKLTIGLVHVGLEIIQCL